MTDTTVRNLCLAIAAIIMALEQALKGAPNVRVKLPPFLGSDKWNFAPIAFLSLAFIIWILHQPTFNSPLVGSPTARPSASDTTERSSANQKIATVANAFIKPEDQLYVGRNLATYPNPGEAPCKARIIRCPSSECEDDGQAISVVLTLGKWQQTEMPTSHEWQERSKKWQEISKKNAAGLFNRSGDNAS